MKLRSRSVPLASGRTAQVFRGGRGPKVVYLHPASGVTAEDRFATALAEHFTVYAPVAPGFNHLDELDDIRDVHEMALAFDDVLTALGLRKVPVIGHSFGGMFAAELAAHVPHRVSRLVLIAPVGLWNDAYPVLDIFATPPTAISDYVWADPHSEIAQAGFGGPAPRTPEQQTDAIIRMVQGLVTAGKFMMPIPDRGLARRLYRVTMPTLLLWGAKDKVVPPEYAADFASLLPQSTMRLIDDAGHMVTFERTDDVIAAIREHLQVERR